MHPKDAHYPVTTSWIVRNYKIPASTIKRDASSGYLPAFRDPKTPKLWKYWPEDAKQYAARRKYVLPAN